MKRRTFLSLAGIAPVIGFRGIADASQYFDHIPTEHRQTVERTPEAPGERSLNIKVIGIGGAGGNIVEGMIRDRRQGVEFICINTDAAGLSRSNAANKFLLGCDTGTAGSADLARKIAMAERSRIAQMLSGADIVFIVAGMGGGTGTGVAPVIGEIARELDILTLAAVTTPFEFEGRRRTIAWQGIKALDRHVDSFVLVPNESAADFLGSESSMLKVLRFADLQINNAVSFIVDSFATACILPLYLDDMRYALSGAGLCGMGSATFSGFDRAQRAAKGALIQLSMSCIGSAPLKNVLVRVAANHALKCRDIISVVRTLRRNLPDETMIQCVVCDESMEDKLRVSIVAIPSERWVPLEPIGRWLAMGSGAKSWSQRPSSLFYRRSPSMRHNLSHRAG